MITVKRCKELVSICFRGIFVVFVHAYQVALPPIGNLREEVEQKDIQKGQKDFSVTIAII